MCLVESSRPTALRQVVLTCRVTVSVHISLPAHITARCSISFFGVCLRYFYCSQIEEQQNVPQPNWTTWWNHSCYSGIPLSALHSLQQVQAGASSTSTTQPLSLTPESNGTKPSGPAPNTQPSLSSIISLIFRCASLVMSVQRLRHCAPCLPHTTLPQHTPPRNSPPRNFYSCVLLNAPFSRTVPLRLHEDLRKAQTPSNTGNAMAATFADATTQVSFAEFFERCVSVSASPPPPLPIPTPPLDASTQASPTQCRSCRCNHPTPARRVLSWVRLIQ